MPSWCHVGFCVWLQVALSCCCCSWDCSASAVCSGFATQRENQRWLAVAERPGCLTEARNRSLLSLVDKGRGKAGTSIFAGPHPPLFRSTIPGSQRTSTLAFAFLARILALQCFAGMTSTVLPLVLEATLSVTDCLQHWSLLIQKQLDRWIPKTRNSKNA